MNIENEIMKNHEAFDDKTLPEGHILRFEKKLKRQNAEKKHKKTLWIYLSSAAVLVLLIGLSTILKTTVFTTQDDKITELRKEYDAKMEKTVALLEETLEKVDDSTRIQLEQAIDELTDTSEILASIAPLPEEKQIALSKQIFNTKIESLERIYRNINK